MNAELENNENVIYFELYPKGPKGDNGYTPQKYIDYYTIADKNEIEADVINTVSNMIPDVSNFITATVNNLVNYYLKTDVYNKDEINALISTSKTGIFEVVSELPTPSLQTLNKIYLVPSNNPKTQNVKDEYLTIPINDGYGWENIGSTSIDLSGYATETWVNRQISDFLTDTEIQQLINTAVNAKYTKPLTGIPKTDLASDVQTSLNKADSALQEHQDISGKLDTSKVKNANSTTAGDVYDVRYINTMIGDVETVLTTLTTGSGV